MFVQLITPVKDATVAHLLYDCRTFHGCYMKFMNQPTYPRDQEDRRIIKKPHGKELLSVMYHVTFKLMNLNRKMRDAYHFMQLQFRRRFTTFIP